MSVETDEDRLSFLDPDEHGESAEILKPPPGLESVRTIQVIFDAPTTEQTLGGAVLASQAPSIRARESDLAGTLKGYVLRRSAGDYEFASAPQPDGTGMAHVELHGPL